MQRAWDRPELDESLSGWDRGYGMLVQRASGWVDLVLPWIAAGLPGYAHQGHHGAKFALQRASVPEQQVGALPKSRLLPYLQVRDSVSRPQSSDSDWPITPARMAPQFRARKFPNAPDCNILNHLFHEAPLTLLVSAGRVFFCVCLCLLAR
jgi:hypothetical protein